MELFLYMNTEEALLNIFTLGGMSVNSWIMI